MTHGIAIYKSNGHLVLTDAFPPYRFAGKTTNTTIYAGGLHPPLVFSRVLATSSGHPGALMSPVVSGGPNAWVVTVGIISAQLRTDTYATHTATIESLIFTTEAVGGTGFGIKVGNLVISDSAKPLIVKNIVTVDTNGAPTTISGVGKSVSLPTPSGNWYGLSSTVMQLLAFDSTAKAFSFTNLVGYWWPDGWSAGGWPNHFAIVSNNLRGLGYYASRYGTAEMPALPVLLVDSYWYD